MIDKEKTIVNITDRAGAEVKRLLDLETEEMALRLSVIGGGCSGLTYTMKFSTPEANDFVYESSGFKVAVDAKSGLYLYGVELDFEDGLNSKGFIWNNPQATKTCGCGESFSV